MSSSRVLTIVATLVLSSAAVACSSGGGSFVLSPEGRNDAGGESEPDEDASSKSDARTSRDAGRTDGGSIDEDADIEDDASASDASIADAKVDAKVDATIDANDGGVVSGQCFDVDLGQLRAIVKPDAGDIVISEWMPDPTAVTDANGEWFELRAKSSFDLNGVQVGSTSLVAAVTATNCMSLAAGDVAVFAHVEDGTKNGLGAVPVDVVTTVNLLNANGTLKVGIDDTVLHSVAWTTSTPGKSIMVDDNGSQCVAPAGVSAYNATDVGTPGAVNTATCP